LKKQIEELRVLCALRLVSRDIAVYKVTSKNDQEHLQVARVENGDKGGGIKTELLQH
jgi:hypothetical protein